MEQLMARDPWLPIGCELPDGSKTRLLACFGGDWQVYGTDARGQALIATTELAQKWIDDGFLGSDTLMPFDFCGTPYRVLASPKGTVIEPVSAGAEFIGKEKGLALASALKASRAISPSASFHDAIYVSRLSRLLPTWTNTPPVGDDIVLGSHLTGGVAVSVKSSLRLTALVPQMSVEDLEEIVEAAGLNLDHDGDIPKGAFTLPGRPKLEAFFNEYVVDLVANADKYRAVGIDSMPAVVLSGPPGCGKTFAVERLVNFLGWPHYSIDSASVGSPFIHDTARKIAEVFDQAIADSPSVLVIDEMESFLSERSAGFSSGSLHHVEEVAEFLRRIPEATKKRVLIVAITNMLDSIDPAILRRGRFDHIIEVGMPSKTEVASLLRSLLSERPTTDDIDVDKLAGSLAGRALSDSAFVVREAARLTVKGGKTKIDAESLNAALHSLPHTTSQTSKPIGFMAHRTQRGDAK